MRKKTLCLIFLLVILQLVLTFNHLSLASGNEGVIFNVLGVGTPDAYGNQINNFTINQDDGGGWETRGVIDSSNYTSNIEIRGVENQSLQFIIVCMLNYTFADGLQDALDKTSVSLEVDGLIDQTFLIASGVSFEHTYYDFWVVYYSYTWGGVPTPQVYDVTVKYYVGGEIVGLNDPTDLDEQEAPSSSGSCGFGFDDGTIITQGYGTYWGYYGLNHQDWWEKAGFNPFNNADAFTISIWFLQARRDKVGVVGNNSSYSRLKVFLVTVTLKLIVVDI